MGYKSGLLEIINEKGNIQIANDIERINISGEKQINHFTGYGDSIFISTPFGIVEYNIAKLQFGDTFYIGEGSSAVFVNQTAIFEDQIFAATENGIFSAEVNNPNLIDFNNWRQPEDNLIGKFSSIATFGNKLYCSKGNGLYQLIGNNLILIDTFQEPIIDLRSSFANFTITLKNKAVVLDQSMQLLTQVSRNAQYNFSLNTAFAKNNSVYLATREFGILKRTFNQNQFEEIHPAGPASNNVFSINTKQKQLWVVYGGYDPAFTPLNNQFGFSHFNGENQSWINTRFNPNFPALDLVNITFDENDINRVYLSSWNSGILVVNNDEPEVLWDDTNSGLEDLSPPGSSYSSIRINGTAFDNQGNLWVANAWVDNRLKKMSPNGTWKSFNLSSIITNESFGLTELAIDRSNNVWIGSRRNGTLVYQESGDKKRALITENSKGSLPDLNVNSLAVDRNNRVWIGTRKGLVVYGNPSSLFEEDIYDAQPIIVEDDGIAKKLLGDQPVNSIAIDGADNKWFGTDTGGVLCTNGSGQETLYNFNKDNSPLPSNRILKIAIDQSLGKVFFATDKGIVAFNNNVAPYGEMLKNVYAYPNPVKKEHSFVTIDGRAGAHLPRGTNVKVMDTAGRLVFETNVVENQSRNGGKVVWNKRNLSGQPVSSGIYIVLLTSQDNSETAITKIAIIN